MLMFQISNFYINYTKYIKKIDKNLVNAMEILESYED